ncbi:MAG: hypothetical protein V4730_11925 [Pseudomonadota bacterium]
MKYLTMAYAALVLSGCAVTADVTEKMQLSSEQNHAVNMIRAHSSQTCRVAYYEGPEPSAKQKGGTVEVLKPATVTRLFHSTQGWYKALVVTQGITDYIFYHPGLERGICGQRQWDEFSNTAGIQFTEVGLPPRKSL